MSEQAPEATAGACHLRRLQEGLGHCAGCLLDMLTAGAGAWGLSQPTFRALKVSMNFSSSSGGRKSPMKCLPRPIFVSCSAHSAQRWGKGERRKEGVAAPQQKYESQGESGAVGNEVAG